LEQLNSFLLERCQADLLRTDKLTQSTYGQLFEQERKAFLPLPALPFHATIQRAARIDRFSTVQFDNARYSVPVKHACQHAVIRVGVETVEVLVSNAIVARHARSMSAQWVLELEHYLPLLQRKPGLLDSGKPFTKANFAEAELLLRKELEYRYQEDGTRQFLRILMLSKDYEFSVVREAIQRCVKLRLFHEEAVRLELVQLTESKPKQASKVLDLTDRPQLQVEVTGTRNLSIYDELSDAANPHKLPCSDVSTISQRSATEDVCYQKRSNEIDNSSETAVTGTNDDARESGIGLETTTVTNVLGGIWFTLCGMFA